MGRRIRSWNARQWLVVVATVIAASMVPWTVFLSQSLPDRFQARHWEVLWVGFDGVMIALLAATAWAVLHRRPAARSLLVATATMFCCDAWFDVVTSIGQRGGWVPILTAAGGEVPIAALLLWLHHRGATAVAPPPAPAVARVRAVGPRVTVRRAESAFADPMVLACRAWHPTGDVDHAPPLRLIEGGLRTPPSRPTPRPRRAAHP